MLVIFIAVYVIGFIIYLIAMGYWQRAYYDAKDYLLALVWPLFLICLLVDLYVWFCENIVDLYVWFCENIVFLGRRLRNGSSKK